MSDIEDWLRAHEADLAEIARISDVEPSVVHIAAVFVLAGRADAEIHQQLQALLRWLEERLDGGKDPLAGAQRALEQIRRLVPAG